MKKRKYTFTLIEIMVCLAILGLIGGYIGIKAISFIAYHKFRISTQTFLTDIGKWHAIAMSVGADVTAVIEEQNGKYFVDWKIDAPIVFDKSALHYELSNVDRVSYRGKEGEKFSVILYGSGHKSLDGFLTLSHRKEGPKVSIDLSYPEKLKEGFTSTWQTAVEKSGKVK